MFTFSTLLSRSPVAGHTDKEQLQVSGWQMPGKKSSGERGGVGCGERTGEDSCTGRSGRHRLYCGNWRHPKVFTR